MKTNVNKIKYLLFLLIILGGLSNTVFAQQLRKIGYIPYWAGDANAIQYSKLTHINYAFAIPQSNGSIYAVENPAKLQSIVSQAHANNVKVLIAIGGWSYQGVELDPTFEALASNADSRNRFVNDAMYIVNTFNLDGVDIDWEYPNSGQSSNNFIALMQALSNQLRPAGKLLSAAVVGNDQWQNGISPSVFPFLDHLNVMAYDDGSSANHSTYDYGVNCANYWAQKGMPKNKIVLGVPFYARPSWNSYATLLNQGANPNSDSFNGDGYNGIVTIKNKSQFVKDNGFGGIMIWELSQDVNDNRSLVSAIHSVLGTTVNPPPPTSTTGLITTYKDCNFSGSSAGLDIGDYTLAQLQAKGILNDDISSLKITQGYKVIIYMDDNFTGSNMTLTSDTSCFDTTWNDKITSIKVRANGATNLAGKYSLQNRNSGLNMDVVGGPGGSNADGVNIQQWNVTNTTNQQFNFEHLGDGVYKITAVHTGKCVDVSGISKENGANVFQWTYYGTPNQQFIVYPTDSGYYKLIAKHSGKVVEVAGYSTVAEANVQQWENVNQTSGQWKLNLISPSQQSTLIQAENYSNMSGIQVEATTDTGGGSNVGYCDTGDWMAYTNINFPTTGSYLIEYRVASAMNGSKLSADLNAGSIQLGVLEIPNTGGWQNWQTISHTVNVNAGTYNFGVFVQNTGFNINWIKITKVANAARMVQESKVESIAISVFPNPVENTLFFSADVRNAKISIVDPISGKIETQKVMVDQTLDVSDLKSGLHLISIEKDGTVTTTRIIKK